MSAKYRGEICYVSGCDWRASLDIDTLPICHQHAWEIAERFTESIYWRESKRRRQAAQERVEKAEAKRGNREGSVVYYARIGDYIKIGYTTRLRNRLRTLRADQLLAIEPGGSELEAQRHREFAAERIDLRRENFRASQRLLEHVMATLDAHGLPQWAALPRTSEIVTTEMETTP